MIGQKKNGTPSAQNKVIALGDAAYVEVKEITTKLDPHLKGPYREVEIIDCKLKIRHLTTFVTKTVYLHQAKRVTQTRHKQRASMYHQ